MSDEVAFLKAAQAQPDDDTLRLVYADWLEEQDRTSQAQFVRLQVRRSQLDLFDPERVGLHQEEARLLRKHKRYWNGGVHRALHARGLRGMIDARRGAIRTWHYHRGMIERVAVTADDLAERVDIVSELGPVQMLDLHGWRDWSKDGRQSLAPLFASLKVLALHGYRGPRSSAFNLAQLRAIPLLDLRAADFWPRPAADLRAAMRRGDLPPVVLFRQTTASDTRRQVVHVIDPHGKWDALRLWFADFTGELLDPIKV